MTLIEDLDGVFLSGYNMRSSLHLFDVLVSTDGGDVMWGRTVEYEPSPSSSPNSKSWALSRPLTERLRDCDRVPAAFRLASTVAGEPSSRRPMLPVR